MTDDPRFAQDAFLVEQLIRPVVNLYRISGLGPDGSSGAPVAFTRQKRLALKEDLRFFSDEGEHTELFRIKARRVLDVGGRYDVTAPDGERIGVLERRFGESLLRTTWRILGPDEGHVATARESSLFRAVLRRVVDIPILYHFTIDVDGTHVGDVRKRIAVRDRYELTLPGDPDRRIDRRLVVALGIALDALQAR